MNRRSFLQTLGSAVAVTSTASAARSREQTLDWFTKARFGLFMHYGIYAALARGEWVQLRDTTPVAEYAKLTEQFKADKFDVDFITDLALDAGMKYVNLTARHHDSFCLFRTAQTDFNSLAAPARRDLIGELTDACQNKGLGIFYYYSYALDWKHPYFYSREAGLPIWNAARPDYKSAQPEYKWKKDADFQHYIRFVHAQITELLTQYGPISGLWLDPIMGYYARPDLFPIEQTYALIRKTQPGCLICFKQGANGDEDYVAPERTMHAHRNGGEVGQRAWDLNRGKRGEICDTLQPRVWGYRKDAEHRNADEVMRMLEEADGLNANLLLNTGPLPDGSIHPTDVATLREVGKRLRRK
ncbi:MAG: alpha-L-fucosidase precursor [bacterium]|nr:alpha-L-fucosidase precursor [bacterium]